MTDNTKQKSNASQKANNNNKFYPLEPKEIYQLRMIWDGDSCCSLHGPTVGPDSPTFCLHFTSRHGMLFSSKSKFTWLQTCKSLATHEAEWNLKCFRQFLPLNRLPRTNLYYLSHSAFNRVDIANLYRQFIKSISSHHIKLRCPSAIW